MKRILLIMLLMLLVGCGAAEPPANDAPTAANDETIAATDVPVVTDEELETEIAPTEAPAAAAVADSAAVPAPATNPTEAAVIRERDWVLGAEEPLISIIEYGDFQ